MDLDSLLCEYIGEDFKLVLDDIKKENITFSMILSSTDESSINIKLVDKNIECVNDELYILFEIDLINNHNKRTFCSLITQNIKHILTNIRFNKTEGQFYLKEERYEEEKEKENLTSSLYTFISNIEGISTNFFKCCICDEETKLKINCNHLICYCCLTKIINNKCPICRQNILVIQD